ncbi:hypothetical protein NC653_034042 [Populus alba x Populus x berolinensis]|uniref:Large ribosomal subunit protein uL18 C-terminal eukaryotes domain-containing protein n=1 Tax=Populus alba x Populus x berolinensis TaxID=444605 RepID=A0AAD6PZV7_9ROSI|nr:hypothetical protein NC653_034042 [Populus alba x Populus x berolinensis]
MAICQSQKSRAYYKRFQVKFKRRREGKTDYRARIRLINQDKNKYNTPKYHVTAQIIHASMAGDIVVAAAYSHELPRYGLEVGLTNYAHLLYRASLSPSSSEKSLRWMRSMKEMLRELLDGGLDIPHSDKRFAGFNKDGKQLDAEVHRKYIYGGSCCCNLMEDEPEKYQSHFSEYIKRGIEPDNMEELYKKVHAAIVCRSTAKKSEKQLQRSTRGKLTYEERKAKLVERLKALNSAADDDEDDDHNTDRECAMGTGDHTISGLDETMSPRRMHLEKGKRELNAAK